MQLCPTAFYKVSTSSIVADHFDTTSDKEHVEDVDPTHKKPSLNVVLRAASWALARTTLASAVLFPWERRRVIFSYL